MKKSFEQNLANLEESNLPIYRHIREFVGSRTGEIMAHRLKSVDDMLKSVMYVPGYYDELEKSHPIYTRHLIQRRGFPRLYGCPEWTVSAMHLPWPTHSRSVDSYLGLYTDDPTDYDDEPDDWKRLLMYPVYPVLGSHPLQSVVL